eukprot:7018272-Prymnesium_polylepis.2
MGEECVGWGKCAPDGGSVCRKGEAFRDRENGTSSGRGSRSLRGVHELAVFWATDLPSCRFEAAQGSQQRGRAPVGCSRIGQRRQRGAVLHMAENAVLGLKPPLSQFARTTEHGQGAV